MTAEYEIISVVEKDADETLANMVREGWRFHSMTAGQVLARGAHQVPGLFLAFERIRV
jgi:hypothetical protein